MEAYLNGCDGLLTFEIFNNKIIASQKKKKIPHKM